MLQQMILNPTPYTLHPTPYTLHPKPEGSPNIMERGLPGRLQQMILIRGLE